MVTKQRLRQKAHITKNQFGFTPGRFTIEVIYLLQRLMERYRMNQRVLHVVFIDLEKAYNRVPKEVL